MPKSNLIAFRADSNLMKLINLSQARLKKSDSLASKSDVIRLALKRYAQPDLFEKTYKVYQDIQKQNDDLFKIIHNCINSNNNFASSIDHLGVNVNQMAKRINIAYKEKKLDDDTAKRLLNSKYVKLVPYDIGRMSQFVLKNNARIVILLNKIINYFNNETKAEIKNKKKIYKNEVKYVKQVIRAVKGGK